MALRRTLKEFIRHMIFRCRLAGAHRYLRKLRGENVGHLFLNSVPERFAAVYRNRVWLNGRAGGALSGTGSELESTVALRNELPKLLQSLQTQVLLDIGCGDFGWMKEVVLPCRYIGIDVVEDVIKRNQATWSSNRTSFLLMDATDPLPPADTVLSREILFHLSFGDIWRVLDNVRRAGSVFLIATDDVETRYNADIFSGDFRMLNLRRSPFRFPAPIGSVSDSAVVPGRTLSVWRVADLPQGRGDPVPIRPAGGGSAKKGG
jgi:hypothetical protein